MSADLPPIGSRVVREKDNREGRVDAHWGAKVPIVWVSGMGWVPLADLATQEQIKCRVSRIEAGDDGDERLTLRIPRGTWDRLGRPLGDVGTVTLSVPLGPWVTADEIEVLPTEHPTSTSNLGAEVSDDVA